MHQQNLISYSKKENTTIWKTNYGLMCLCDQTTWPQNARSSNSKTTIRNVRVRNMYMVADKRNKDIAGAHTHTAGVRNVSE